MLFPQDVEVSESKQTQRPTVTIMDGGGDMVRMLGWPFEKLVSSS